MRVTVTGCGYLGLVHAATLAAMGNHVIAMDVDEGKITRIREGRLPFREPGLADLVKTHAPSNLHFTSSPEVLGKFGGTVHFLCVGTPVKDGDVDLSYLFNAAEALAPHLSAGDLVVNKSTVPPGTGDKLLAFLRGVDVASNPEFLREGTAVQDSLYPERLVFGVNNDKARYALREVYRTLICSGTKEVTTTVVNAELSKLAANAFLATKISFINGVAQYGKAVGADVGKVSEILGLDSRIGQWGLRPGLGFGGGCLPKDLAMLTNDAADHDVYPLVDFLDSVSEINDRRRSQVRDIAADVLGDLSGKRVSVLGAAFKPGTDDTRESPGLLLAGMLTEEGAHVIVHDPSATGVKFMQVVAIEHAVRDADLVIVATEHEEYVKLDPSLFPPGRVIDARYCLDRGKWEAAGWEYHGI